MKTAYFLIGASGAGKTTAAKEAEKRGIPGLRFFYFDSIGVPSFADMEKQYGSGEEWQRVKTIEWGRRLKATDAEKALLDGQTRPTFIDEACKQAGISDYKIVLFDCSDEIRRERLNRRGQPELASDAMMHWAKNLREGCAGGVCTVIDNSNLSMEKSVSALLKAIDED